MIALMWGAIAVIAAACAVIVAAFVRAWHRDAIAGRHASIPGTVAEPQERTEEDADEWWRECEDDALPAALQPAGDSERALWPSGEFRAQLLSDTFVGGIPVVLDEHGLVKAAWAEPGETS